MRRLLQRRIRVNRSKGAPAGPPKQKTLELLRDIVARGAPKGIALPPLLRRRPSALTTGGVAQTTPSSAAPAGSSRSADRRGRQVAKNRYRDGRCLARRLGGKQRLQNVGSVAGGSGCRRRRRSRERIRPARGASKERASNGAAGWGIGDFTFERARVGRRAARPGAPALARRGHVGGRGRRPQSEATNRAVGVCSAHARRTCARP